MNKPTTTTARRFASFASKELNALIGAWEDALAARRKTKAEFDYIYAAFVSKKATYEQVAAAYSVDREAVIVLQAAHAAAQSAYSAYARG